MLLLCFFGIYAIGELEFYVKNILFDIFWLGAYTDVFKLGPAGLTNYHFQTLIVFCSA